VELTVPRLLRGRDAVPALACRSRPLLLAIATSVLCLAGTRAACDPATDVLDQRNEAPTALRSRCDGAARSLFQAFRPAASPLAALAIEARDVPATGERLHLRVRAGSPWGPILGEAHAEITTDGWVRVDFASALALQLDDYYLIEWVEPRSWWACRDDDPYRRGEAYNCAGTLLPNRDFNFRTWAPQAHWESRTWSDLKRRLSGALYGE
jgi:hypothetical protein